MKSVLNHISFLVALLIYLIPNLLLADYYVTDRYEKGELKIGTLATIDEVCKLIDHPVFTIKQEDSGNEYAVFRQNLSSSYQFSYLFIPIDNEIKEFKSMLKGYNYLSKDGNTGSKMLDRISHFPECFKFRNIGEIPNTKQENYGVETNYPLIQWTQEKTRTLEDYYSNLINNSNVVTLSGYRKHSCIGCIFFLKEMHPILLKRFDELYAIEVVRLKTEETRNAALQVRKKEERVRQKALERKEAEEIRLEALSLMKKEEAEKLRLKKLASIEEEKLRLEQIRIQQKAESERLKLQIALEKEQINSNLIIFFVVFIIVIFTAGYLFYSNAAIATAVANSRRLQLAREEQKKKEKAEKVKSSKTKWENKKKKIQKQIQDTQLRINKIDKLEDDVKVQIHKIEIEKKSIEENINDLKDEIKNEKNIVKELREKYPFIDSYIDNR